MMGGAGMMGVWMIVFLFVTLLTLAALLVVSVQVAGTLSAEDNNETTNADPDETKIERLQRRYAEGDLTEAEFERELERELEREDADMGGSRETIEAERTRETERPDK